MIGAGVHLYVLARTCENFTSTFNYTSLVTKSKMRKNEERVKEGGIGVGVWEREIKRNKVGEERRGKGGKGEKNKGGRKKKKWGK